MPSQTPTKLTVAAICELINGIFSLVWAALGIFALLRGGFIASFGQRPITIITVIFAVMGVVYVAFGVGLWQRLGWARTGSFVAGAIGILVGLLAPLPLISAILNLIMVILLRDGDVRNAFVVPTGVGQLIPTGPEDPVSGQPRATQDEWQPSTPPYRESRPATYGRPPQSEPEYPPPQFIEEPQMERTDKTLLMKREPKHLAWLIPTTGSHAGTEFRLRDETTIGRDRDNDIPLDDDGISARHLKVRRRGDGFELFDQATTNGTAVNGEQVLRHTLQDGDLIKIGNTTLLFMRVVAQESQSAG